MGTRLLFAFFATGQLFVLIWSAPVFTAPVAAVGLSTEPHTLPESCGPRAGRAAYTHTSLHALVKRSSSISGWAGRTAFWERGSASRSKFEGSQCPEIRAPVDYGEAAAGHRPALPGRRYEGCARGALRPRLGRSRLEHSHGLEIEQTDTGRLRRGLMT